MDRHRTDAPAAMEAFGVAYHQGSAGALLDRRGTLAVFSFGAALAREADPRHLVVPQAPLDTPAPHEAWTVDADVACGEVDGLRWARGGGWQFLAIEPHTTTPDDIEAATLTAYDRLLAHAAASAECHLLRIWNYIGGINTGEGDAERYRRFCSARARSMAAHGVTRYPAATAIGHRGPPAHLQVYALCGSGDGAALENPRQVSAWEYPREYGPAAPRFTRAMRLPRGGLAISGTAAVTGHASRHTGDIVGQCEEALANLDTLLREAALPAFDATSPLKVYVRDPGDAEAVRSVLARRLDPFVPRLLLQGDICRSELLVEIDGWRLSRESGMGNRES